MNEIFDIIKASKFFPKYAPKVKNVKHKLRGIDGNKKPIEFSEDDKIQIKKGLQKFNAFLQTKII